MFSLFVLLCGVLLVASETFVQHQFVNKRLDAQGWVHLKVDHTKSIQSIVWHRDVQAITFPDANTLVFPYYPANNTDNCILNAKENTLSLRADAVPGGAFWVVNKAFVLIDKKYDDDMWYQVITITNSDMPFITTVATTLETTTVPTSTVETTSDTTTITTVPVDTTTVADTTVDTTTVEASTVETTMDTTVPVNTTTVTDSTVDTTTVEASTVETTTTTVADESVQTSTVETTTSKSASPTKTTSTHRTRPPSNSESTTKAKSSSKGKNSDAKSNVVATAEEVRFHSHVPIVVLSVFGAFVLLVVILVAIRGNNASTKEKSDDDIYGYAFDNGKSAVDTREQDLQILQSLGKGASAEFQANL